MRKSLLALAVLLAGSQAALAQQDIVDMVVESCQTEIDTYCSQVTPGEGRVLACFYAHEDKLSVQCVNALYDGMAALDDLVNTIAYVANQCAMDIDTTCAGTPAGEGRIAQCLLDNKATLSEPCVAAIDETGLTVE